jgi:uncharacterized Zn ribbon protein
MKAHYPVKCPACQYEWMYKGITARLKCPKCRKEYNRDEIIKEKT